MANQKTPKLQQPAKKAPQPLPEKATEPKSIAAQAAQAVAEVAQQAPEMIQQTQPAPQTQAPQPAPQPIIEEPPKPKPMSTIEKITVLSDYANAVRDPEVMKVIQSKPNGDRLYELFANAISTEIETLMNPNAQDSAPKALMSVQEQAHNVFTMIQRLGGLMAAIEQGPALATLGLLVKNLGGRIPEYSGEQPLPPQGGQPPPQQPPQQPFNDQGGQAYQGNDNRGRRGPLGSW